MLENKTNVLKKSLIIAIVLSISTLATAQSIIGKWKGKSNVRFVFKSDSTYKFVNPHDVNSVDVVMDWGSGEQQGIKYNTSKLKTKGRNL